MTITPINSSTKSAKPDRGNFRMNGATPLGSEGIDAALQRLDAIDALTTLLSLGFATSSDMDSVNPKMLSAAFDGISLLSAEAAFALTELD